MGILTLALVANGTISSDATTPIWVVIACAVAISAGTYIGGWRIIRTLGKGLIEIESPQGFAAEATSAAVILTSASRCPPPRCAQARSSAPDSGEPSRSAGACSARWL
jgi:PiT family inorganic phosphate transporter